LKEKTNKPDRKILNMFFILLLFLFINN